jgi:hypothetical protein
MGEAGTGKEKRRRGRSCAGPLGSLYHLASNMLVTLERMPLAWSLEARSF